GRGCQRHPARHYCCSGQLPRLPAARRDSGHLGGSGRVARADQRPPRAWLRFKEYPRHKLHFRGLLAQICEKGKPAPIAATKRWVVERTNSWSNARKKLVWCTERV
ncbi:MAG: hypothetical protein AVDCRST_MAG37-2042, partial [uncultured Rubrobacteraceae bacterium]